MTQPKSTVDEIRGRFDQLVDKFSRLETGQTTAIDSPLALDLISQAAARTVPNARRLLDVGCGAGNYSLKLLERLPGLSVTLVDLSRPMLTRAVERVSQATTGEVQAIQGDIREVALEPASFDLIVAAAVLHHLRDEAEWNAVFHAFYAALRPGGSLWVFDLVESDIATVAPIMWEGYGAYLASLQGDAYRDGVLAYIAEEDSPRPLLWQLERLRAAGFAQLDVLHKHLCFAAFGAIK